VRTTGLQKRLMTSIQVTLSRVGPAKAAEVRASELYYIAKLCTDTI
jgi:hypothetical protein